MEAGALGVAMNTRATSSADRWKRLDELSDCAIDWRMLVPFEDVDPYVAWADSTKFAGTSAGPSPEILPFLIRLAITKLGPAPALAGEVSIAFQFSSAGLLYASVGQAYFTGSIKVSDILKLRPGRLVVDDQGNTWRIDAAAVMAVPRVSASDPKPLGVVFARGVISSLTPLIAVIDDGCPFANLAYRRSVSGGPGTRVQHLWDQSGDMAGPDPSNKYWGRVAGFGYGREVSSVVLDQVMQAHLDAAGNVDEDECYRTVGLHDLVGAVHTHGAHVLGLAAGAPNPVAPPELSALDMDAAAEAEIIFVQLPSEVMRDTSGGGLARHVLDALRYIDLKATELNLAGEWVRRPVVINVSVGAAAGPHDGTALVEKAIDDFIAQRPACAVMVAAGNSRGRAMHTRSKVAPHGSVNLTWLVGPDDGTDSFLELWTPVFDDAGTLASIGVRLVPPDMTANDCPLVGPGDVACLLNEVGGVDGAVIAAIVNSRRSGNSDAGNVVLCAVAPTLGVGESLSTPPRALACAGAWQVEVVNLGDNDLDVAAWIERDETTFGGPGRQAEFDRYVTPAPVNEQTLSSLAHGACSIVVGGYALGPDEVLDEHSGEGPGRSGLGRRGPDLIAPSSESPELPGILSCGVHSGEFNRMGGTSVATAIATRRVYNHWIACPAAIGDCSRIKGSLPIDEPRRGSEPESRVGLGKLGVC